MERIMNILEELNKIVSGYRDDVVLEADTSFADIGFDSLDRVELVMAIEEKFDIEFPDDVQVETVAQLIETIEKLTA